MNNEEITRTSINLSQSDYVKFVRACFDKNTTPNKVLGEAARKYLILNNENKNKGGI